MAKRVKDAMKKELLQKEKNITNRQKTLKEQERESREAVMPISNGNKGFALLQKMGYKPGQGLGKAGTLSLSLSVIDTYLTYQQIPVLCFAGLMLFSCSGAGRVEPIPLNIKTDRGGIGMEKVKKRKAEQELEHYRQKAQARQQNETQSLEDFRFTQRVIINGKSYPEGVGKTKKEARQMAAKHALNALEKDPSHSVDSGMSLSCSSPQVYLPNLTQPNYICWLNEQSQKNRVSLSANETTNLDQGHLTPFVVDGKTYPIAFGRTKKEAKEEAAKLAYQEICSNPPSRTADTSCDVDTKPETQSPELNREISEASGQLKNLEVSTKERRFSGTNFIGIIHHYCQKTKRALNFSLVRTSGPPHCPQFFYRVVINGKEYPEVEGKSAKEAKQNAAKSAWASYPSTTSGGVQFRSDPEPPKARLKHLNQDYAVKMVRCKGKAIQEAAVLAELQHQNIVRYYTSWLENNEYKCPTGESSSSSHSSTDASVPYLFIQMELCKEKNLQVWIDEKNGLRRDSTRRKESLDIMKKLICGVEYVHSQKLIHRDLKPANIMFALNGELKIGDFGLVTDDGEEDDANMLAKTRGAGTRSYMAPEQKSNQYDRKVDIFALGLIYFVMIWKMETHQEKAKIWEDVRNRKFLPSFTAAFLQEKGVIYSMLCGDPESRPNAKQIKEKLERPDFLQGSGASSELNSAPF
ncbi:hypothetical protein NHX12_022568 [Muraenolepis orangiensis]|uniref:Eukaryotic translation initiation factor 2 alpha kinase 2 n=1 Tax=Muraenolepis orangiensis TaxID=630683 RepID=A0A9Q0ENU4_9TELE|nr:hypothetical protein NHX12_022568 [Muraenolepis orangiensis]